MPEGSPFTVMCVARGEGTIVYMWLLYPDDNNFTVLLSETNTFTNPYMKPKDSGWYTCIAETETEVTHEKMLVMVVAKEVPKESESRSLAESKRRAAEEARLRNAYAVVGGTTVLCVVSVSMSIVLYRKCKRRITQIRAKVTHFLSLKFI
jgi:hypothetical protein